MKIPTFYYAHIQAATSGPLKQVGRTIYCQPRALLGSSGFPPRMLAAWWEGQAYKTHAPAWWFKGKLELLW